MEDHSGRVRHQCGKVRFGRPHEDLLRTGEFHTVSVDCTVKVSLVTLGQGKRCEWEVIVQGDEGPVCGVAQVVDCHGVTVGHQEREEVEDQQEVEGEREKHSKNTAHVHGWDEGEKTSASGLSHVV